MPNEFRLKDFHKTYVRRGGKLTKKDYKNIVQTFLNEALEGILEGKSLVLGYRIGEFNVRRVERSASARSINWSESNKYKAILEAEGKPLYDKVTKEGYEWLVYYTDNYYYRYTWKKDKVRSLGKVSVLHNVLFYELQPFRETQRRLTRSINNNELAPIIHELLTNNFRRGYCQSNA